MAKIILDQADVKTAVEEYLTKRMIGQIAVTTVRAKMSAVSSSVDVGSIFDVEAEFGPKALPLQTQSQATPVGSVEGRGNTANAVA